MPEIPSLSHPRIPGAPPSLNFQELLNVASRARGQPYRSCHVSNNLSGAGSFNFTVPISFEDGIEWIAKCPRGKVFAEFPEIRKLKLESEVATLQLLKQRTTIPVPEIFAWNSSDDNPVGIPYILMGRAKGKILDKCGWYSCLSRDGINFMNPFQRFKIYAQLAQFIYQLSSVRFPKIGSVFGSPDDGFFVGDCLRVSTLEYGRAERGVSRGPFSSAEDYYYVLADVQSHEIWDRDIYLRGVFFHPFPRSEDFADGHKDKGYIAAMKEWNKCAVNEGRSIENKLDYKVFADILHEMIADMHINDSSGEGFPLEHSDLGLQNIFVDDDFNITCIIDWELCSTVPVETLITHPPLPSRASVTPLADEEAFEKAFQMEDSKVDPGCRLTSMLRTSRTRRDFDRFMHKDDAFDDCVRFARLFKSRYGDKDMKEYFQEKKNTQPYLAIREELERLVE